MAGFLRSLGVPGSDVPARVGAAVEGRRRNFPRRWRKTALLLAILCGSGVLARAEDRKVERRVPPIYPELAKRMRVAGTVRLNVRVSPEGAVVKVQPASGNPILVPAAEDAVRRWKYAPASGETNQLVDVNFQLD